MTTLQRDWLAGVQELITNRLDAEALAGRRVAAILGDVPSTYAKSPSLWNAAFAALDVPATYVSLDIPAGRLEPVVQALRSSDAFLGGSVTVPYKSAVIPLLDEVDPLAAKIGAVNVIVRTPEGRLIGYNTDGLGGVAALTEMVLPGQAPLLPSLKGVRALVLGAGGAAQAVAVYLWDRLGDGQLVVANRSSQAAASLVGRLTAMRAGRVEAVTESQIAAVAPSMDLIMNATLKGQAEFRKLPDGRWTSFEPYSGLAPALPAAVSAATAETVSREAWFQASSEDIRRNQAQSLEVCARLPKTTVCYDIIYAPRETVFLQQARWSGHQTLNGQAMNLSQAIAAFTRYVCRDWLLAEGWDEAEMTRRVTDAMAEAWAK